MPRPKGSKNKPKEIPLGDAIAKVTEATGIKKVVETVSELTGKDCGCNERQELANAYKLTSKFPYINKNKGCMNEEQIKYYEYFKEKFFGVKASSVVIKGDDLKDFNAFYNSVNRSNIVMCSGCTLNPYIRVLDNVYNAKEETKSA